MLNLYIFFNQQDGSEPPSFSPVSFAAFPCQYTNVTFHAILYFKIHVSIAQPREWPFRIIQRKFWRLPACPGHILARCIRLMYGQMSFSIWQLCTKQWYMNQARFQTIRCQYKRHTVSRDPPNSWKGNLSKDIPSNGGRRIGHPAVRPLAERIFRQEGQLAEGQSPRFYFFTSNKLIARMGWTKTEPLLKWWPV